ncbi:hypothetical protein MOQ_004525 [Trypanosoma cruzi marinkellei]|uniref:Transmembrane protein n=1 Tax=Trypanosoma cruzi marinkellei TaxID=85056 RepID=K2N9V6_TRYCR|nr:hypothetical protein MOQ_004525 [Trypanosoma cruzi marinkellei]
MRVYGLLLLMCTLLGTTTATGRFGTNSSEFTSTAPESRGTNSLQVVIYLNATACSASEEIPQSFFLAFEEDLIEGVLPEISSMCGASFSSPSLSCLAVCSFYSPPQELVFNGHFGGAGASFFQHPTIICEWKADGSVQTPMGFYPTCRKRVQELYVMENALEATNASNSHKKRNRYIFGRSSEVYYNMTGDARHLVAVGGDCYLIEFSAESARKMCGRVTCLEAAMIVLTAVIAFMLVVAVMYLCRRQLFVHFFNFGLRDGESSTSSQLIVHLPDKNESHGSTAYEAWRRSTESHTPPASRLPVSFGDSNAPPSRSPGSNEADFKKMDRVLSNTSPRTEQSGGFSDRRQCLTTSRNSSQSHFLTPWRYRPPRVGSNDVAVSEGKKIDGLATSHSEKTSSEACEVDISKEEREQLQRQRSWLREHVIGLDAI